MPLGKKVLSIQSHVVHGYVGNKAATFPLQYRGWDVDALNTVEFSNHPGNGKFSGFKATGDDLRDIIGKGLLDGLGIKYDAVLLGYLPDADGLQGVAELVAKLRTQDANLIWVVDPVLGDNGVLYMPLELVPVYKNMLKHGDVTLTTPNQFEMELLTDLHIVDSGALLRSIETFHMLYPKVQNLVVTSLQLRDIPESSFVVACSDFKTTHCFKVPKIDVSFSGSGDFLSAMLLHMLKDGYKLPEATNKALTLVDKVLRWTFELAMRDHNPSPHSPHNPQTSPKTCELRLIESRHLLRDPVEPKFTYTTL
ncbi:putative pyridoxal kinase BUD17 Ecym_2492 [Eremothecium cymbalariae DBVPG|uniref:pyridoxal kinase n=1 Tax=Eremothecium cymbalariae (strain CBS 270.75 / DBVPG 7215 / KCTC 17166 / NRRL Y-17582) TaxID=931890 RepID=G8JPV6_ERECY|nr:Hypothetical protein Ecym_2492 [Eremothecium cymbalariae DBVPG\